MNPGVVEIEPRGRLGNWLAQYCVGRRIATELGFSLVTRPVPGFPNAMPLGSDLLAAAAHSRCERIDTAHEFDLAAVVAERQPRVIRLNGFFLRYEYFQPYKAAIRDSWLDSGPLVAVDPDDLTIHIRAGDVWRAGAAVGQKMIPEYHALPFSFYAGIIGKHPWRRIRIVTEDAKDAMAQKIATSFGATIHSGAVIDDFNLLRASHNLVPSVSSFAWWAAWLSKATRIYYPVAGLFDPRRAKRRPPPWRQDLWVFDEQRYLPVTLEELDFDWLGTEEQRAYLLEH